MASGEPKPLYTITDMRPEFVTQADGSHAQAYRVDFQTATGHRSYVIVPRSSQLDSDIHATVAAEAQLIADTINRPVAQTYGNGTS
jgi:hypothetical protein